jgi:predicted RNA-binding protein with PUA-like domain
VRNAQARNNLRAMKLNDEVLFYHSQKGNCIMGIMKVIEEAHQDKTTNDANWVSVTFEPTKSFENPISLQKIKNIQDLNTIGLIKQPRLAVLPINETEYNVIIELGNQSP